MSSQRVHGTIGTMLMVGAFVLFFVLLQRMDQVRGFVRETFPVQRSEQRVEVALPALEVARNAEARIVLCPQGDTERWPTTVTATVRSLERTVSLPTDTRFTWEEARANRCLTTRWQAPTNTSYRLVLGLSSLPPTVQRVRIEAYVGARITVAHAIPIVFCLLGLLFLGRAFEYKEPEKTQLESFSSKSESLPVDFPGAGIIAVVAMLLGTLLATMEGIAFAELLGWKRNIEWHGGFNALLMLLTHGTLATISLLFLGVPWHPTWREAVALRAVDSKGIGRAFLLAMALVGLALASARMIEDVSRSPMGRMTEHAAVRYAVGFGALLAPVSEELFYRGVLLRAFGRKNAMLGVALSTAVFVLAHTQQLRNAGIGLVPIGTLALVNGVLRVRTGSLTEPWLVHTFYNGVLVLSLFFA